MSNHTRVSLGSTTDHADVDALDGHIEVTYRIGRTGHGLILSADEAYRLADALRDAVRAADAQQVRHLDLASIHTVEDIWAASDETGIPAHTITRRAL